MPTNPRAIHKLIMPCSFHTIKLLTTPSRVGHTVFRALSHCGTLCLAKQSKLLFFTSPKTSSPCFYSAPENRDWVSATLNAIYGDGSVHSGCYNKTKTWMTYKQQAFISDSSEGWEVQDHGVSRFSIWWEHASYFIDGVFLLYLYKMKEDRKLWPLLNEH